MPLSKSGKKVMAAMKDKYWKDAESVFYASINAKRPGSSKWEIKSKKKK